MRIDFSGKHIFITGGSSGIGLALANLLAREGANITILARREELLNKSAAEIQGHCADKGQIIRSIAADVADMQTIFPILEEYQKKHGVPDYLFNSAGITYPGEFNTLTPETLRDLINVDYLGTAYVTRALINGMLQRGSGWIVNISSMAGYLGTYGYSGYGAAKFAVRGFSDVLRAELKPHGIRVSVVYPPDTLTPQLEFEKDLKPAITKELAGNAGVISPEEVARIIIKDMRKGRYTILPGFQSWFYYVLSSLLGDLTYNVMDMEIKSAIKKITKKQQ